MNDDLPEPLTPPECDLRDFPYMPLMVSRLRRSRAWLLAKRQPELGFYMVNLWTGSWHELPAASLEDDDDVLADIAMCTAARWAKCRDLVLHGWVKCADGRWYHPVVAEQARETFAKKRKPSGKGRAGAAAKWNTRTNSDSESATKRHERLAAAREKGRHTGPQWQHMLEFHNSICVRCGDPDGLLVKDHIIPIYQGGSDAIDNLQPLCRACNSSKGPETTDHRTPGWGDMMPTLTNGTPANIYQTPAERLQTPSNRREGKGREEKKETSLREAKKTTLRGTRLPDDWTPGSEGAQFARDLGLDPKAIFAVFRDYWQAKPGKDGVKLDWIKTWRNWCRSDADRRGLRPNGGDLLSTPMSGSL